MFTAGKIIFFILISTIIYKETCGLYIKPLDDNKTKNQIQNAINAINSKNSKSLHDDEWTVFQKKLGLSKQKGKFLQIPNEFRTRF